MKIGDLWGKFKKKVKSNKMYQNLFGFESGIDLTNDAQVLHRKNQVIKNIIFFSNVIFTIIFAFISIGDRSNLVLMVILFPTTFFVNYQLSKLIKKGPEDVLAQRIAMYVACFYMFLLSLVIYIKLKNGTQDYLKEAGYILLYYSILISAYYQDRGMLKNVIAILFIGVTILHFVATYNVVSWYSESASTWDFVKEFFSSTAFRDILLRTLLLGMFSVVAYIFVSMTNYMQEERKKELIKRKVVQEEFTNIINNVFDISIKDEPKNMMDANCIEIEANMARRLATLYNLSEEEQNKVYDFCLVVVNNEFDNNFDATLDEDKKYEEVKTKTSLWIELIKRNNLERECETILRATYEKANDDSFRLSHSMVNEDIILQIVLLCEIYVTLRRPDKRYKNAYSDEGTIKFMEENIRYYFNPNLFDRFITYQEEFNDIYVNSNG